jgi:hypothetical protein
MPEAFVHFLRTRQRLMIDMHVFTGLGARLAVFPHTDKVRIYPHPGALLHNGEQQGSRNRRGALPKRSV